MIRSLIAFYAFALLFTSCSITKNEFGQTEITDIGNLQETKQEILTIKSLDNDVFDSTTFINSQQEELSYRLFNPEDQKKNTTYPLVVVFHGSAGIGDDNQSQLRLFQKLFSTPSIQKEYPAYVLAPQFSTRTSDYAIDTVRNVLSSTPRPCLNSAFELIDSLTVNLNIDCNRIYVVGYSMGASTTMNALIQRPDLFAAGISISGIPQFDALEELAEIPIWMIHGTEDLTNPINSDEQFYAEMETNIRFWKLKGKMHDDIVIKQILGDALPKWLFKHRKK